MTDAEFWSLIDDSRRKSGGSRRRHENALRQRLRRLTADDIAEFNVRFGNLVRKAYHWDLWAAAFIIGGGCSDDGFWDFRCWLVSQGKRSFDAVLKNPDCLIDLVDRRDKNRVWLSFGNPADCVWSAKTGRPEEDCPRLGSNLGEKPTGLDWDETDLPRRFPKLWKHFGSEAKV